MRFPRVLTSNKQRNGSQSAMLGLKALQQRCNRQSIKESMEEASMDDGISVKSVH